MITPLGQYIKAFNAFTHDQIPGGYESDTGAMTVKIRMGTGQFALTQVRSVNHYVRVNDDAPDDVKRQYPVFVNPLFAPPPLGA